MASPAAPALRRVDQDASRITAQGEGEALPDQRRCEWKTSFREQKNPAAIRGREKRRRRRPKLQTLGLSPHGTNKSATALARQANGILNMRATSCELPRGAGSVDPVLTHSSEMG